MTTTTTTTETTTTTTHTVAGGDIIQATTHHDEQAFEQQPTHDSTYLVIEIPGYEQSLSNCTTYSLIVRISIVYSSSL